MSDFLLKPTKITRLTLYYLVFITFAWTSTVIFVKVSKEYYWLPIMIFLFAGLHYCINMLQDKYNLQNTQEGEK